MKETLRDIAALLDALHCGAFLVDSAGRVIHANVRLCEMFDRPAEELAGTVLSSFYEREGDRERVDRILREAHRAVEEEFHIPRPDGTEIPVIISGQPLSGTSVIPDCRVLTVTDITRQKEAEEHCRVQYSALAMVSDTAIEEALAFKKYSTSLEERVRERTEELREANMDAIVMLAVASEAKDADTGQHVRRIRVYSETIARELGLTERQAERIGYSAVLHDIGKIHIPDSILQKPGRLDDEERTVMQKHTVVGERILSRKRFFETAREIAYSHHENWDGSGYPDGLAGEDIPLSARIVRVADVFDALTSARVYKAAWSVNEAREYIRTSRDTEFDREIAAAFLSLLAAGRFDMLME